MKFINQLALILVLASSASGSQSFPTGWTPPWCRKDYEHPSESTRCQSDEPPISPHLDGTKQKESVNQTMARVREMVDGHMRQLTAEAARRRGEIAKLQEGLAGQNISVVIEGAGKLAKLQVALDELKQTMVRKAIEGTLVEILAPNPSNKIVKELNALFGIAKEIRNQYRRNSDMWKDLTRLLERICDLINLRHPVHQLRPPQAEAPPSQSGQPRGGRFCKSPGGSSSYGGSLCDQSLSHPYVRQGPSSWQQPVDANPDYPW